jgi:hypothetical protein
MYNLSLVGARGKRAKERDEKGVDVITPTYRN